MSEKKASDYTCVPTAELAAAFHAHRDRSVSLAIVAERADLDPRDLKKIVNERKYRTTGLSLADRILTAVGANLTSLAEMGELTVIPSGRGAAVRMYMDEKALCDRGPQWRARRVGELVQLREDTLKKHP